MMAKKIQYASSTIAPLFLGTDFFSTPTPAQVLTVNNSNDSGQMGSFLDFTETECSVIFYGFLTSSIVGSTCNLFLLVVLLIKMWCDSKNKSPSDQLVAFLTTVDLIACALLFPLECEHFSHQDCNIPQRKFDKFLTLFLELASTGALLNIAVCRYLLVCWATRVQVTFKLSIIMSAANICISLIGAAVANLLNTLGLTIIIYLLGILSVMVLMVLLYYLIFLRLYKRTEVARKRSRSVLVARETAANYNSTSTTNHNLNNNNNNNNDSNTCNNNNINKICNKESNNVNNNAPHIELTPVEHHDDQKSDHDDVSLPTTTPKRGELRKADSGTYKSSLKEHGKDDSNDKKLSVKFNAKLLAQTKSQPGKGTQQQSHQVSQMELMMKRSAKIFVIITAFYILCFLPNAILTLCYFIIGPAFIQSEKPLIVEYIIKYCNLFYNLNFILTPLVYASLNRQFREDFGKLRKRFFGGNRSSRAMSGKSLSQKTTIGKQNTNLLNLQNTAINGSQTNVSKI